MTPIFIILLVLGSPIWIAAFLIHFTIMLFKFGWLAARAVWNAI